MRTKRQLCLDAYGELALASDIFDLSPEELQTAASRLNSMMAVWETKGIQVGFNFGGGLDEASGLTEHADTAAFMNLAVTLAARKGKALTLETKTTARDLYEMLLGAAVMPPQQRLRADLPYGAGNKSYAGMGSPVFTQDTTAAPLSAEVDGELIFKD